MFMINEIKVPVALKGSAVMQLWRNMGGQKNGHMSDDWPSGENR